MEKEDASVFTDADEEVLVLFAAQEATANARGKDASRVVRSIITNLIKEVIISR